jgi:hypothetical protein
MAASAFVIQQKVGRVADLMEKSYGLRGQTLRDRVQRAGRKMPSDMRRAAERLAKAEAMVNQPKLLLRLDDTEIDRDYRLLVKRLETLPRGGRGSLAEGMKSSVRSAVLSLMLLGLGIGGWVMLH